MSDERFEKLRTLAFEFNAAMPRDVFLKGDGSLWVLGHDNGPSSGRRISQEEALKLIYKAIQFSNVAISV